MWFWEISLVLRSNARNINMPLNTCRQT
jgi:hypothetical protein